MNAIPSGFYSTPDARAYGVIERSLQALPDSALAGSPHAVLREFEELRSRIDADVEALRLRLFAPSIASSDDDKAAGRWVYAQHRRLARVSRRLAEGFSRQPGADAPMLRLVALALHYSGETVKGHIKESRHHDGLNALMRLAMAGGHHRDEMQLDLEERVVTCTLEALYFRALLLARMSGGGLTPAQIEILDAWLWMWMPALAGADKVPEGATWRADLDSNLGLRRGARLVAGASLYLPEGPLEAARISTIREFHRGRAIPTTGYAAGIPIEDHIAVLDALRRGLREARRAPVARAMRSPANVSVQLHVGLAEIMEKGFARGTRASSPFLLLPAAALIGAPRMERERDNAFDGLYDPKRRIVQLVNVSASGVGLEAEEIDCVDLAVGDLVGLRLTPEDPLLLGKIARRLPADAEGRVMFGLRRISSAARPVLACQPSAQAPPPERSLLYIPGEDQSGRHDAYLTSEESATDREPLETIAGDHIFTFRFNRVRERGRGWAMAGFEVTAARRVDTGRRWSGAT